MWGIIFRCYAFASRPFSPWHVASLVAPVDVLYFPSPQSSHVETPVEELNFPAAQSEQEIAPTALNVPAEQGSQSELEAPSIGL